jgi:hypothetical protein
MEAVPVAEPPPARKALEVLAGDGGRVHRCPACGETEVEEDARDLAGSGVAAFICLGLGGFMLLAGAFIGSILLGLPEIVGYRLRGVPPEIEGKMTWVTLFLLAFGGFLGIYYPLTVLKQATRLARRAEDRSGPGR